MLTVKETMKLTEILMSEGKFDTAAWINSHTEEEARAVMENSNLESELGALSSITDPDTISLIDIWRHEGQGAFSA